MGLVCPSRVRRRTTLAGLKPAREPIFLISAIGLIVRLLR
jgi:hypothetical protein